MMTKLARETRDLILWWLLAVREAFLTCYVAAKRLNRGGRYGDPREGKGSC